MTAIEVGGLRIAYRRRGRGTPVLLMHGAFEDARVWDDEFERLAPHVDLIAWDAPGCGDSGDVPDGWSDRDWADAASGFLSALGVSRPVVAGFSMGSVLALLMARDHPESVGSLVLVGAYAGWGGSLAADALAERIASARLTIEHPVDEWADGFLDSVVAADASPERRALMRRLLDDWRPSTTRAMLEFMARDLRPALAGIQAPTVVVRGTEDARSPREVSLELCRLLPHAGLVEIAGAGHDCSGPELDAVILEAAGAASV